MNTIDFVFTVHNHQPIGNFEKVLEDVYQTSYKPFLEVLKQHPKVKFTQHWTGTLLEWLLKRHPGFLREMKTMVRRGQLELLTGAYYEAILPIIPEEDRVGQIRKLTAMIEDLFDYEPRGMWLAERVWEPHLVSSLKRAGIEFIVVDDTHFRMAGLTENQLQGYYVTEDGGETLNVFPIDKTLRYTVPFRPIEETKQYLKRTASEGPRNVVVHADDGEKFGAWPKTYASVYEHGWLRSFCSFLEQNNSWLETVHFGETTAARSPLGRIYLPTASYHEMMKWVLPPIPFMRLENLEHRMKKEHHEDEGLMFVRGGFWRNFLAKYPESNHMHKRMLRVRKKFEGAKVKGRKRQATLDLIWAAQCNDPYWHGVFGGMYLPNLRHEVYRRLLLAEAELDRFNGPGGIHVDESDMDCDGAKEIILESPVLNLYFKPATGGSLVELDFKPASINLLDIVSRREEGYHRRLISQQKVELHKESAPREISAKDPGIEENLQFDWYRHASLVDHCFAPGTTLEEFRQSRYLELGDFVNGEYESEVSQGRHRVAVTLVRHGAIWRHEKPHRISIRKKISYDSRESHFSCDYEITNGEASGTDLWFGVEINVGLMAGDAHDRYYDIDAMPEANRRLGSSGEEENSSSLRIVDEWLGIETCVEVNKPATFWRCPLETISLSEGGLERLYQSSMIIPNWKIHLRERFEFRLTQSIHLLRTGPNKRIGDGRKTRKPQRRG